MEHEFESELAARSLTGGVHGLGRDPAERDNPGPASRSAADAASTARANILATGEPAPAAEPEFAPTRNTEHETRNTDSWPITRPNIPGAEPGESPLMTVFRQARTEIGGWGTRTERVDVDSPGWAPVEYALTILGGSRRFGPNIGEMVLRLSTAKTTFSADNIEPPQEVQAPPAECKCELTCYRPWYYGIEHLPQGWDFKSCQTSVGFYLVGKLSIREKDPPISKPFHVWCEPEGAVEFLTGSLDNIPRETDRGMATLDGDIQCTGDLSFTMRAKRAGACKIRAKWGEQECPPINILIREDCSCEILCTHGFVPFPKDWEKKLSSSSVCVVPPYEENTDMGYATLLGRVILKGSSKEWRPLKVTITPVTGVDLALIEHRHLGVIDCWIPLRPEVVQCGTTLDFCAHFRHGGEYELTATWGDVVCKKLVQVGQCDVEEVRNAAAIAQAAASVSVTAAAPVAERLSRVEYIQQLAVSRTRGSVAVALENPDSEPIQGFVDIRTAAEVMTASKWAPKDCCCLYISDLQVMITISAYFTGTAISPFREILKQLSEFLKGPEAVNKAREALGAFDPHCKRAVQRECKGAIDLADLNDHLTRIFAQLCSDNSSPLRPMARDGSPVWEGDEHYDYPATAWSSHEMGRECARTQLPIKTLRIKVVIASNKTAAEKDTLRRELAQALKGASAIFMQCCIRLDPQDMDENAIEIKSPVDTALSYSGEVPVPANDDIRTKLVYVDSDSPWVTKIVRDKPATKGHADFPRVTPDGRFVQYGGIASVWAANAAIIAHEIGHNAGLATEYTAPLPHMPDQDPHEGYISDVEVMGALAGHRWRSSDCVTLRRFVEKLDPYWIKD
ncbi:hypothetical protein PLCT2_00067 [Planctomycetaceae bacterium]|nr:hypothetical protein PLCT2_00067 [Planctomycetaceae bacterium]